MIRLSVLEIEGGTLSVTEEKEKKDWSWSILVVGFMYELYAGANYNKAKIEEALVKFRLERDFDWDFETWQRKHIRP